MIWDSQKNEPFFRIDKLAMVRIVEKQSIAIHRDLKSLEITAIVVLMVLGITTLIDTFFNGKEYFQLWSVAIELTAAGFLWWRRRRRESEAPTGSLTLLQQIEWAISQGQTTIQRGRDLGVVFSVVIVCGIVVRICIYGWQGSEIKLAAAMICVAMLTIGMKITEKTTHRPRTESLGALRQKLLDVSKVPLE